MNKDTNILRTQKLQLLTYFLGTGIYIHLSNSYKMFHNLSTINLLFHVREDKRRWEKIIFFYSEINFPNYYSRNPTSRIDKSSLYLYTSIPMSPSAEIFTFPA